MTLNEIIKQSHDNAVDKGFYNECETCMGVGKINPDGSGKLKLVKEPVGGEIYCPDCKGSGVANDKNIGELLMLVVSELGEALEAHRKNHFAMIDEFNKAITDGGKILAFECRIKDTFEDELADAVIRICDMCGYKGIDLEKHIELKMRYNETREYKHGKAY